MQRVGAARLPPFLRLQRPFDGLYSAGSWSRVGTDLRETCLRQDPQRTLQGLSRLDDVPELEIDLVNRPDLPSAGAGETPIIAIAPAIANAAFRATSTSVQAMPVRV
jgi:hypothetical protein